MFVRGWNEVIVRHSIAFGHDMDCFGVDIGNL